jgi:hypothetical protein
MMDLRYLPPLSAEESAPFIDESQKAVSGKKFLANTRKWESSLAPTQ